MTLAFLPEGVYHQSVVYPDNIANRLTGLRHNQKAVAANAVGTGAHFGCGSFVRISLAIDVVSSAITDVGFASNGCGFMAAAADLVAEKLIGRHLRDLHGLANTELLRSLANALGEFSLERNECFEACFYALRAALADFRASRIEEFSGEKALICTCFGVTEERIDEILRDGSIESVDDVSAVCNAGLGCGSCRMMIEEMIDARVDQS